MSGRAGRQHELCTEVVGSPAAMRVLPSATDMALDARRFDLVAETQILLDEEVAHGWELLRAGIQRGLLAPDQLPALIGALREGGTAALGELVLAREPGGERAQLSLDDDRRTCGAAALLDELERLSRRAGVAAPAPPPPTIADPAAPSPARPGADPSTDPGTAPEVIGLLSHLLGATTPEGAPAGTDAARANAERVRLAVQGWHTAAADPTARDAAQAELRAAIEAAGTQAMTATGDTAATARALGLTADQIAGALRTIADWLEERTPSAGAAVDRLIAALEAAIPPLPGAESDADRQRRLRDEARASIAARIKLPPR